MQENRQEKSCIKQKILLYLSKKNVSQYEFYKITGITRGVLSQNNGLNEENLMRFLDYAKDINLEWLFYNNGEMCKSKCSSVSTPEDATPIHDSKVKEKMPENQEKSPLISELLDTIKEQAETIGRLKARIEDLEGQIADPPSDMASAG